MRDHTVMGGGLGWAGMRLPFSAGALLNESAIESSDEEDEYDDEFRELALVVASEIVSEAELWERNPSLAPLLLALPDEMFVRIISVLPARDIGRACCTCRTLMRTLEACLSARAEIVGIPPVSSAASVRGVWWLARRLLEAEWMGVRLHRTYDTMGLRPTLRASIHAHGLVEPCTLQQRTVVAVAEGRDVLAQLPPRTLPVGDRPRRSDGNHLGEAEESVVSSIAAWALGVLQSIEPTNPSCQALVLVSSPEVAEKCAQMVGALGAGLGVTVAAMPAQRVDGGGTTQLVLATHDETESTLPSQIAIGPIEQSQIVIGPIEQYYESADGAPSETLCGRGVRRVIVFDYPSARQLGPSSSAAHLLHTCMRHLPSQIAIGLPSCAMIQALRQVPPEASVGVFTSTINPMAASLIGELTHGRCTASVTRAGSAMGQRVVVDRTGPLVLGCPHLGAWRGGADAWFLRRAPPRATCTMTVPLCEWHRPFWYAPWEQVDEPHLAPRDTLSYVTFDFDEGGGGCINLR